MVNGLKELDCFPLVVPVSGDIHMEPDVKEFWSWLNAFKGHGIDLLNELKRRCEIFNPDYKKVKPIEVKINKKPL